MPNIVHDFFSVDNSLCNCEVQDLDNREYLLKIFLNNFVSALFAVLELFFFLEIA